MMGSVCVCGRAVARGTLMACCMLLRVCFGPEILMARHALYAPNALQHTVLTAVLVRLCTVHVKLTANINAGAVHQQGPAVAGTPHQ